MIIISPFSKKLRSIDGPNPKDYPYWQELIYLIKKEYPYLSIIQVGLDGEKVFEGTVPLFNESLSFLKTIIKISNTWISVDNFFHHLASQLDKKGIVLWSQSDPNIFGDCNNINILKDRKYLRKNQFDFWEATSFNIDSFVKPGIVFAELIKLVGS